MKPYRIDKEFESYLRPHTAEETQLLSVKIEGEGCLPGSIVVANIQGDMILMDGHNTHRICEQKGIKECQPIIRNFPNRELALEWMEKNQFGRRNLSDDQKAELRRKRIERVAAAHVDGQSTRAIAHAEGISNTQVVRDLEAATVTGVTVQPPGAQIRGRDGILRPSKGRTVRSRRAPKAGQESFTFREVTEALGKLGAVFNRMAHFFGLEKPNRPGEAKSVVIEREHRGLNNKIDEIETDAKKWYAKLTKEAAK